MELQIGSENLFSQELTALYTEITKVRGFFAVPHFIFISHSCIKPVCVAHSQPAHDGSQAKDQETFLGEISGAVNICSHSGAKG